MVAVQITDFAIFWKKTTQFTVALNLPAPVLLPRVLVNLGDTLQFTNMCDHGHCILGYELWFLTSDNCDY